MGNGHAPALLFYNRKGFYSLNVQIICDVKFKILNINAKNPASVHDYAVWQTSNARDILKRRYKDGDHSSRLIGDLGYPLEPWLFTPVAGTVSGSPKAKYSSAFRKF